MNSAHLHLVEEGPVAPSRPRTRAECPTERPCPFTMCKFHLYLDVDRRGEMRLTFPDKEVWEIPQTCVLDLAERGGMTLEEVGRVLNLTRERVRQLEARALGILKRRASYEPAVLALFGREPTDAVYPTKRRRGP